MAKRSELGMYLCDCCIYQHCTRMTFPFQLEQKCYTEAINDIIHNPEEKQHLHCKSMNDNKDTHTNDTNTYVCMYIHPYVYICMYVYIYIYIYIYSLRILTKSSQRVVEIETSGRSAPRLYSIVSYIHRSNRLPKTVPRVSSSPTIPPPQPLWLKPFWCPWSASRSRTSSIPPVPYMI